MMKVVVCIEDIDVSVFSEFVFNHPSGNIFQTPFMAKVYKETENYEPFFIGVLDEKGSVLATLLAVIQKEYKGVLGKLSSRAIIMGGPIVKNDDATVLSFILEHYNKQIRKKAIYTQIRNQFDQKQFKNTFLKADFEYEEHLNILIDLNKTEDELWKDVHTKRRNEIRRASKEGTKFEMNTTLEGLRASYDILKEVYTRAKLPLPSITHFEALLNYSKGKMGLEIGTAVYEKKIIGCMLILVHNNTIYDYYAGAYAAYYKKYPNDLIPWEIFKWGKLKGYSVFDFGGAGKPNIPYGVRDYKKKFGGEMVNYGRFIKIHKPFLYKIVEKAFLLFQKIK